MKIKINPYKIGLAFYIIMITMVISFTGCSTWAKYKERIEMKQQAKEILNTPNLK